MPIANAPGTVHVRTGQLLHRIGFFEPLRYFPGERKFEPPRRYHVDHKSKIEQFSSDERLTTPRRPSSMRRRISSDDSGAAVCNRDHDHRVDDSVSV